MAICLLNKDLLKSNFCGYSLAEIKDIYLANYEEVSATTTTAGTSGGVEVATITMGTGKEFYHIEPAKGSANYEDALVVNDSGSKYRTHTLNFNFIGAYNAPMVDVVDALSLGRFIAVIALANGSYVMLGRTAGLEAEVVTDGGSADDSIINGIQVTLSANVAEAALPLTDTAIATVKGE